MNPSKEQIKTVDAKVAAALGKSLTPRPRLTKDELKLRLIKVIINEDDFNLAALYAYVFNGRIKPCGDGTFRVCVRF